jgi:hypothetical protein
MRFALRVPGAVTAVLAIAGCAAAPAPDYSDDHPANPRAAAAPATAVVPSLSSYRGAFTLPAQPDDAKPSDSQHRTPGVPPDAQIREQSNGAHEH